ncbi:putative PPE family protein PPE29 [Mycobacterium basiliense]|uniref:Putative PPE family protein PPE29 n=1 Tax=Mycobacterium basiliense TaxID=2094119 RepID=A0A3S4FJG0_9MYCO|nr:putative PPE family protein PPE29 [Mycobacterium basiliense]
MLPPEVNSGRMYAGPGSSSLLDAAVAWEGLAEVLDRVAASYRSVVAELAIDSWLGPAAAAMSAVAAHCIGWLSSAAVQAKQAAGHAEEAVAAFETAHAMTVPPSLIAANRSQLLALATTNVLGQNSPAIEATQAEYAEMWAQDATAMYNYEAESAAASAMTPFEPLSSAADLGGTAAQAAAVTAADNTGIETSVQAVLTQLVTICQETVQALATPVSQLYATLPGDIVKIPTPIGDLEVTAAYLMSTSTAGLAFSAVNMVKSWTLHTGTAGAWHAAFSDADSPPRDVPPSSVLVSQPGGGPVSASSGRAAMVGSLTVPHGWTLAAPEVKMAVQALPGSSLGRAALDVSGAPAGLLSGMALAGLGGRSAGGAPTRTRSDTTREDSQGESGFKPAVVVIKEQEP